MRKGVALAEAALRRDVFVAASEGNRLELTKEIFLGFSIANFTTEPTWSLFTLLTMVTTRTISMARFVQVFDGAELHVKNRLPIWRWLLASLPMRRIAGRRSATRFDAFFANSLLLANSMPWWPPGPSCSRPLRA